MILVCQFLTFYASGNLTLPSFLNLSRALFWCKTENVLNRGWWNFWCFFSKKVLFLGNIGCCPNFLDYRSCWPYQKSQERRGMEKLLKDRKILRRGDGFSLGIFLAGVWQIYTVVSSYYRLHTSCLHQAGVTL